MFYVNLYIYIHVASRPPDSTFGQVIGITAAVSDVVER